VHLGLRPCPIGTAHYSQKVNFDLTDHVVVISVRIVSPLRDLIPGQKVPGSNLLNLNQGATTCFTVIGSGPALGCRYTPHKLLCVSSSTRCKSSLNL